MKSTLRRSGLRVVVTVAVLSASPSRTLAQLAGGAHLAVNSEVERYLRILQLLGKTPHQQWTVRPFGPSESEWRSIQGDHPWVSHIRLPAEAERAGTLRPALTVAANSSFPYGFNDGPLWAGKGLTGAVQGGGFIRHGGLSLQVAPMAFVAQNADFSIAPNGLAGDRGYGDWFTPGLIDEPQRFGRRAYARVDPGESEFRYDGFGLAAGATSTSEFWGPASEHPVILGNNAGGIPRVFIGTARPAGAGGVKLHGRVLWGRLDQSDYAADSSVSPHYVTAIAGVMTLQYVPGLELGAARFFHTPATSWRRVPWTRPFQAFFRGPLARADDPSFGANPDNQLASLFLRWAPPGTGIEAYAEYGREDRNSEWQDLLQEPDHDRAYLLGLSRAWNREGNRIAMFRAEVLNSRITHLAPVRQQSPWYVHSSMSSGHTQRGQVLGSAGGHGGGAGLVAIDWYSPRGRTTVRLDRLVEATALSPAGLPIPQRSDIIYAVGVERARFTATGLFTTRISVMKEFNRYFGDDAINANFAVSFQPR